MKPVVIGTAGHIDHGKSALVLALTGTDPDRLKEERERGITIDLGFAHVVVGSLNLAFVDVPGHERFVKNMLAGVGGIDAVLFVVASDESVMPQTREHFEICRLLEIPAGVIALTKVDLVDRETLDLVRMEVHELIAGSFLETAPLVPVSVKTGEGLGELREALAATAVRASARPTTGPVRLPIDRAFAVRGFGTVVTGTLVSGTLHPENVLDLLPSDRRVKVRGLQVHGERQTEARAGQRTAVNLTGADWNEVRRGMVLAEPGTLASTEHADAVLDLLPTAKALKERGRVRFHQATSEVLARVTSVGPRGAGIQPGTRGPVRLRFETPAILTRGDRFIIRAYSPPITIGGGRILDPRPARTGVRTAAAALRAEQMTAGTAQAVVVAIGEQGAIGLSETDLTRRFGLSAKDAEDLVTDLVSRGLVERILGDARLLGVEVLRELADQLQYMLRVYHETHPHSEGMPREEARVRLSRRLPMSVFAHVISGLEEAHHIVGHDQLALASHRISFTDQESTVRGTIECSFRAAGLKPPDFVDLATKMDVGVDTVERFVKMLIRQKVLVKLDALVFHVNALEELKADVRRLKDSAARFDVGGFKERYGITRKFAIPLLEYLDRERITRREGDGRTVL